MEEYRQQQIEALQVAHEYSAKLINGINNVTAELKGNRLLDTDQYLDEVIKGLNWLIEITNRTLDVINEDGELINKNVVNDTIKSLGSALSKKEDSAIANALETGVLEFVKALESATARF